MNKRIKKALNLMNSIKSRSIIKDATASWFVKSGSNVSILFKNIIDKYVNKKDLTILDFGAGSGRVVLRFAEENPNYMVYCCDVDNESVEYIKLNSTPNCIPSTNNYIPPLDYNSGMFDVIYAVSVWSHFPKDLGIEWLKEMKRVLREGGIIIISFASYRTLDYWKEKGSLLKDITVEEFENKKFVFKEYHELANAITIFPGIAGKGSWGDALIHPDFIEANWSKYFEIIGYSQLPGVQDLVILKKVI